MTSKEKLEVVKALQSCGIRQYRLALEEVEKDLKILEILKEFMQDANTGTGWIEININPEHDILDSEEHKAKQKIIKEWLENEKSCNKITQIRK